MDRVAIFVDVQNIYYTTKQVHDAHFDYNAFWRRVSADPARPRFFRARP